MKTRKIKSFNTRPLTQCVMIMQRFFIPGSSQGKRPKAVTAAFSRIMFYFNSNCCYFEICMRSYHFVLWQRVIYTFLKYFIGALSKTSELLDQYTCELAKSILPKVLERLSKNTDNAPTTGTRHTTSDDWYC